jgi:hypothetical protein
VSDHDRLPASNAPPGQVWEQGDCWLWCQRQRVDVTWIGPASVGGLSAPMYACEPCIRQLGERVWLTNMRRDGSLSNEPHRASRLPKFYPV